MQEKQKSLTLPEEKKPMVFAEIARLRQMIAPDQMDQSDIPEPLIGTPTSK